MSSVDSPGRTVLGSRSLIHALRNRLVQSIFGILVASELVHAQQPVAELGGWPPGAFTLLVGLWIAARCALQRNFDTSFPPCTRAGLHRIQFIKRLLWAGDTLGKSVTVLVLSSLPSPQRHKSLKEYLTADGTGVWEWDILTIYKDGNRPSVGFSKVGNSEGNTKYELRIVAPPLSSLEVAITFTTIEGIDIDKATSVLFDTLFDKQYECREGVDSFLLCWRGLQNFHATWDLRNGGDVAAGEEYNNQHIVQAVKRFKENPSEVVKWDSATDKLRLYVENPTDTSDEAAPGTTIRDDIFHAGQLVSLLIYVENFQETTGVNPLIPLIWFWTQGMLEPTDNFTFNLRPFKKMGSPRPPPGLGLSPGPGSKAGPESPPGSPPGSPPALPGSLPGSQESLLLRTGPGSPPGLTPGYPLGSRLGSQITLVPQTDPGSLPVDDTPKLRTPYEIELCEGTSQIDGGGYLGSQRYAWIWSTVVGAILTFFASLTGTASPSFATALGLSMLRPYSNDHNYRDAGSPLSWNGRRRIRWAGDKECGIFSGPTELRLGKTGNSLPRACLLMVISWATWYWRLNLRGALSFVPPVTAATWVKWVAIGLEAHAGLWMFLGAYFYYVRRNFLSVVVVNVIAGTHVFVVTAMMIYTLRTGRGQDRLFYVSEGFTITGCMITGQTFVGVGSEHVYVHHAVTLYWSHIVASSCFSYSR